MRLWVPLESLLLTDDSLDDELERSSSLEDEDELNELEDELEDGGPTLGLPPLV